MSHPHGPENNTTPTPDQQPPIEVVREIAGPLPPVPTRGVNPGEQGSDQQVPQPPDPANNGNQGAPTHGQQAPQELLDAPLDFKAQIDQQFEQARLAQEWARWRVAEHGRLSSESARFISENAALTARTMLEKGFRPGFGITVSEPHVAPQYDENGRIGSQTHVNGPHRVGAWLLTTAKTVGGNEKWVSEYSSGMVLTEDGRMMPYVTPQRDHKRTAHDTVPAGETKFGTLNIRYDGDVAGQVDPEMYYDTRPTAQQLFTPEDIRPDPNQPDARYQMPVRAWSTVFSTMIGKHIQHAQPQPGYPQAQQWQGYPQQGQPQPQYPQHPQQG
jgi:hypothetical protein